MELAPYYKLGAQYLGQGRTAFCVWSPQTERLDVHCFTTNGESTMALDPADHGYFVGMVDGVYPGDRYRLRLADGREFPDPASRWQPDGVHGPSAVTDPSQFDWHDENWKGVRRQDLVLYELHVGTFSPEGTFKGIIPDLPRLVKLGITAIELMPIAQFPGERNWGYDGVFPFAAQNSYGGPRSLARLVDACHAHQVAVILDVVYNHMGPEGSVLAQFAPYFNSHYQTPWGQALNFDGPDSDQVREYFWQSARDWIVDYHLDGLRLDAVHAIIDTSAHPFVRQLTHDIDALSEVFRRPIHLIAESDRNDPREVAPRAQEGLGFSGQWNDDFHHALHALVTGERNLYYADYGTAEDLAKSLSQGYVFTGQYSPNRKRRHGRPFWPYALGHLVNYAQNHDQIGNRARGDRLTAQLDASTLRVVAATTILSPTTPMLFMGEEYGERAPFPYFISHTDPDLIAAVREGRAREWASIDDPLDPADPNTYLSARLESKPENDLFAWYRTLLALRRELLADTLLESDIRPTASVINPHSVIQLTYRRPNHSFVIAYNFSAHSVPNFLSPSASVLINSTTPETRGTPLAPLPRPEDIAPHSCLAIYFV